MSTLENWYFDEDSSIKKLLSHFKISALDGLGVKDYPTGIIAAGALLTYLYETQKAICHILSRSLLIQQENICLLTVHRVEILNL